MKKTQHSHYVLTVILSLYFSTTYSFNINEATRQIEEEMQTYTRKMRTLHEEMMSAFTTTKAQEQETLSIDDKGTYINVIITGIKATELDAHYDRPGLTIKNSQNTITITKQGNILSVELAQQTKKDDENKLHTHHQIYARNARLTQTVPDSINLKKATIGYEPGILTVTIPKELEKKEPISIPITVAP